MSAELETLLGLATSISDGEPVDWDRAEAVAPRDERDLLHGLRTIAGVAELHRRALVDAGSTIGSATTVAGPPAGRPALEPGQVWGHLRIQKPLGRGGYGEVYLAWDSTLDRQVALKLYHRADPRGSERSLVEEGRLLARVRHPNVVDVYGADVHDRRPGLWMEYVRGRSLAKIIGDGGTLGAREATLIGIDLCRALAATHRVGLVHGDVKAHNVLREEGGRIVLMDFGAGGASSGEDGGRISGTPLYMAPELFTGAGVSVHSDIYSFGVLLHHLVTGRFPVLGRSMRELGDAHRLGYRNLLRDERPDLPEAFLGVVERATAADPAARFDSAGAAEAALVRSLGLEPAPGAHPERPAGPRRLPRGRAAWTFVGVLGVLALAAGIGRWVDTAPHGPDPAPTPPAATLIAEGSPQREAASPDGVRKPAAPPADAGRAKARSPEGAASGTPVTSAAPITPSSTMSVRSPERAAAAYTVEATFFKSVGGEAQTLLPGAPVELGDKLFLEFQASTAVHFYVVNEDERGSAYLLFPLPGQELRNPLPAGERLRIPGTRQGQPLFWQVTSQGGREHFLLLASPTRLVDLEADLLTLERAESERPLLASPLDAAVVSRLRGVGGLAAGATPERLAPGRLSELAHRLASRPETVSGIWIRQLTLENAGS